MTNYSETLRIIVKKMVVLLSCMFMVIMAWEGQQIDASVVGGPIPQESIRLRILANSDSPSDQLVKREIRDAIVEQMELWVLQLDNPQSLEEAKALTRQHLPEIRQLVGEELSRRGITYSYNVELDVVPFPTKLYGGTVYPAGDYDALRITLGEGQGQNWWCVLFPPLCFIDGGSGDAAAQPVDTGVQNVSAQGGTAGNEMPKNAGDGEPQVRFFLWDMLLKIWDWVTSLF
ncbi:stage II sporulation protein R [Bacillus sp. FJAT-18019]|uniref:Stage II sporulation protein R n=1 Tax=Paenibacillus solani TaxID=1705565 RepID=A0A0M1N259_9BACL|nr:stage II sporulation protein R [Paenibacillus solani]KOP66154.1 stage II sporulation protein R [Bacillus sp. FJAT-18019]KOR76242.1 stage II sporulation protein R [Paenibacillus solani]